MDTGFQAVELVVGQRVMLRGVRTVAPTPFGDIPRVLARTEVVQLAAETVVAPL